MAIYYAVPPSVPRGGAHCCGGSQLPMAAEGWRVGRAMHMQLPSCRSRVGVSVRLCSPLYFRVTHTHSIHERLRIMSETDSRSTQGTDKLASPARKHTREVLRDVRGPPRKSNMLTARRPSRRGLATQRTGAAMLPPHAACNAVCLSSIHRRRAAWSSPAAPRSARRC